jgi:hypothetical protein
VKTNAHLQQLSGQGIKHAKYAQFSGLLGDVASATSDMATPPMRKVHSIGCEAKCQPIVAVPFQQEGVQSRRGSARQTQNRVRAQMATRRLTVGGIELVAHFVAAAILSTQIDADHSAGLGRCLPK